MTSSQRAPTQRFPKKLNPLSRSFRLRTTLVVPFVLQIFAAVGLVGWLSFRSGQESVNDVASQLRREVSNRIEQNLENYLKTPYLIHQINLDALSLNQIDLQNLPNLEQHFWKQIHQFPEIGFIGYASDPGEMLGMERLDNRSIEINLMQNSSPTNLGIYTTDKQGNRIKLRKVIPDFVNRKRPWYQKAVQSGKATWSDIFIYQGTPRPAISAVVPVYNKTGQLQGVLFNDFILSLISDFLKTLKIGKFGQTFIIERSGMLVASSTEKPFFIKNQEANELQQIPQRLSASESRDPIVQSTTQYLLSQFKDFKQITAEKQLDFTVNNQRYFAQVSPFQDQYGLNWLIVVVVPESDFMSQIEANTRRTILLCLAALIVAIIIGILNARWITRPLLEVSQASEEMAGGTLEQHIEPSNIIEIRRLASSFNSMAGQLKESFEALAAKNEALQQSESRNQAFLNAIPDLILRVSQDGIYLDLVEVKEVGMLADKQSHLGRSVYDVLPQPVADQYMHHIQQAVLAGETQAFEYQLMVQGQRRDYEARVVRSGDEETILIVRDITAQKRAEKELQRMSAELDILREMQQLILPKHEELEAISSLEIAGFMEPADEVGGDYYDVLDIDGVVTIGIGDVTGHGLESGILMVMTQTAVRTLKEIREVDPVRFLDTLNRSIYKNLQRMNSDKNLTLVVLNYTEGQVSISGQHEETLVVRASGEIERINTMDLGFPIGLDEEIADFINPILVQLNPGDGIVLYTDGITEARDIRKKQYGLERLCEVITQHWQDSAEEVKEAVITDLRQHIGQQKVFDDITLLVVKQK